MENWRCVRSEGVDESWFGAAFFDQGKEKDARTKLRSGAWERRFDREMGHCGHRKMPKLDEMMDHR